MTVKILKFKINENELPVMIINLKKRSIISIPTQLGCAIGCTFCISSESSFVRNLKAKEMRLLVEFGLDHITNKTALISFTGEGEPFLNLKQINEAMRMLHMRSDVDSFRLCTSGIKPVLFNDVKRYSVPVNIQLSLHSPFDEVRKKIIPKSKPISQILHELKKSSANFDEIAINYVLMKGVNDSNKDRDALVNLIYPEWIVKFNPLLDEEKYQRSNKSEDFADALTSSGKRAVVYGVVGSKISNGLYGNLTHSKNNRIA